MTTTINEEVPPQYGATHNEEAILLLAIIERGLDLADELGHYEYRLQRGAVVDCVIGCHVTTRLRLQEMLDGDDGNFGHDFFGILRYFDTYRQSRIEGFYPRFGQ